MSIKLVSDIWGLKQTSNQRDYITHDLNSLTSALVGVASCMCLPNKTKGGLFSLCVSRLCGGQCHSRVETAPGLSHDEAETMKVYLYFFFLCTVVKNTFLQVVQSHQDFSGISASFMDVIAAIATAPLRLGERTHYQREKGDLKVRIIPECFVFQTPAVSPECLPHLKINVVLLEHDYTCPSYQQRKFRHLPYSCDFQRVPLE